ncbi:GTPase HflX, partial [Saccharothrix sp. MB29]|nr:GTPase HflX [Saccharothrix sp. MB29]
DALAGVRERIAVETPRPEVVVEALVPYARGEVVARVHREGEVLKERHTEEGTELSARVRPDLAGVLEQFAVDGSRA